MRAFLFLFAAFQGIASLAGEEETVVRRQTYFATCLRNLGSTKDVAGIRNACEDAVMMRCIGDPGRLVPWSTELDDMFVQYVCNYVERRR